MVTQANAKAIVNGVAFFTTPHTFARLTSSGLGNAILDRHMDLADLHFGEGGSNVEGRVNVTLEASECIGSSEVGQTMIEGLAFYFK